MLRAIRVFICVWLVLSTLSNHAEGEVQIEPLDRWSTVFGDADVEFRLEVKSTETAHGELRWSYSANRRTIARGQMPVKAEADRSGLAAVPLKIPNATEDVVLQTVLSARFYAADSQNPVAEYERLIWIFPHEPFVDRARWLKELRITLFDPEGATAERFDRSNIPYEETRNIAALTALDEGLIVIGEGISLLDYRSLGEDLVKLAAGGIPVLCLAPVDGVIALPTGGAPAQPLPGQLTFRRSDVITELDKRFDSVAWSPDGRMIATGLRLKSDVDRIVAEVSDSQQAWPWLEVRYPGQGATLVVCGFRLIEHWDGNPTPRFLLRRLLEYIKNNHRE